MVRNYRRRFVEELSMRVHQYPLKTGISRTPGFEKKGLTTHAVNVGTKCGNNCLYCSTGVVLRMHPCFRACGENPFDFGYAIVDLGTPERVARDAVRIQERGLVQLCTLTDAWAPEAQEHRLGRRCLEAILCQPGWMVRILTKNAAVADDFDLIERYRDRVLVGLSVTGTLDQEEVLKVIEPHASPIRQRMAVLREAHARGLQTYGMFCPILPGIAHGPEQIDELVRFAWECGAEEIFAEAVNRRGRGLILMEEALEEHGCRQQAEAISAIRNRVRWSRYVVDLIQHVQSSVRRFHDIGKLRFLLYPSGLTPGDVARVREDDAGVVWLGKHTADMRRCQK
jgi:DNA repair photolyase